MIDDVFSNPELRTLNFEPLILAIETSCDETAAALTRRYEILSSLVSSQVKDHQPYGGVVPELASRKHITAINFLIDEALAEVNKSFDDLDGVAVSTGPGLVGALMVGVACAKTLAFVLNKPLIAVNHLEAHIFSVLAGNPHLKPPFICLVISGGHTLLVLVKEFALYQLLGQTLDDAAGEAFDKVGKLLGLPYPGGPQIEKAAARGNKAAFDLPRPLLNSDDFNFSFSGLKTAVVYLLRRLKEQKKDFRLVDVAASFQEAVADVLLSKTIRAVNQHGLKSIAVVGGVSANNYLRQKFEKAAAKDQLQVIFPVKELSTDNAAMVGLAAYHQYINKNFSGLDVGVEPNLGLPASS